MRRGMLFLVLLLAALPLSADTLFSALDPTLSTATSFGTFAANRTLSIVVTGTIDLLGNDGTYAVRADGSLANPPLPNCCGFTGLYAAYVNPGTVSSVYASGNPFAGGGTNFDVASNVFPAEGKPTLNGADPGVIRLGAIAYTFATNPTATDWLALVDGNGLATINTGAGGTLKLVVVDTAYWNNTGSFNVSVNDITGSVPEPSTVLLALSGIGLVGMYRLRGRRSTK